MMETDGGLILSLPQKLLFDAGNAQVKETGVEALYALAGGLNRIKNRIEIVGHTDPRAIKNELYPSNWELSLARSANVAGVLESVGYSNAITIRGHAAARYSDMDETIPVKTRLDLSRRVDIVVMEDDGKRLKLFNITQSQ
jgi:chemotaxis protein MotB